MFDDHVKTHTLWRKQEDLPPLLDAYRGGVDFRQYFAAIANGSKDFAQTARLRRRRWSGSPSWEWSGFGQREAIPGQPLQLLHQLYSLSGIMARFAFAEDQTHATTLAEH